MKVTYRLIMEDHCQPELEMPSPESIAEVLDLECAFAVVGRGPFPFELMQDIAAAPATSRDSAAMARANRKSPRLVALICSQPPTEAPWAASGWPIRSEIIEVKETPAVPAETRARRPRSINRTYTFTVAGWGLFPFDMLRYDRCTPKTERDSGIIERTTNRLERQTMASVSPGRVFRVTLVGPKAPTEARWGSFGWEVESVER